jgi:hypothetical protein
MDLFSVIPLYVEGRAPGTGDHVISRGTAFCVTLDSQLFLVTARHVLLDDSQLASRVDHHKAGTPGRLVAFAPVHLEGAIVEWEEFDVPLYDEAGRRAWRDHAPEGEEPWDVAVIRLAPPHVRLGGGQLTPLPAWFAEVDLAASPGEPVNIIGFPWGQSAGGPGSYIAIWKTGFLAGEISLPWCGKPCFLVDATTTKGMSGSPVFAIRRRDYRPDRGEGAGMLKDGTVRRFLGVYTGKIRRSGTQGDDTPDGDVSINVGAVWTWDAILAAAREDSPAERPT